MRNVWKISLVVVLALCGACSIERGSASEIPVINKEFLADAGDPKILAALDAIGKDPSSGAYVSLASRYISIARESGNFSLNRKAEKAVDMALGIKPDDLRARKLKASLLATFHRFDEARALANELRAEIPGDPFIYGVLVDANVELGNYEEAIAAAQKMVDLKPNSSSYARAAHLRSLYGDHKGAVELYTLAARTADPGDNEAQSWCLVTLAKEHIKHGELDQAQKILAESLAISPGYGLALLERANVFIAKGDYQQARANLTEVIGKYPTQETYIRVGDIDLASGNSAAADENYKKAEEIGRGDDGDMHRFALLWADRGVRLDEALAIAQKDYETNKDIYASDILAWCLYKAGRYDDAKQIITQAMRLNTNDARILYHAGMIHKALGESREAREFLTAALRANPSFDLFQADVARQALQEVDKPASR